MARAAAACEPVELLRFHASPQQPHDVKIERLLVGRTNLSPFRIVPLSGPAGAPVLGPGAKPVVAEEIQLSF